MKKDYLIGFLIIVLIVLGYYVVKKSTNKKTAEQNQSAVATTKLETFDTYQTLATPVAYNDVINTNNQKARMYEFTKTLSLGSTDLEVEKMSQLLADYLYYSGKPTKTMDKNLVVALSEFQSSQGLEVTGSTGPKTRDALTVLSRGPSPCSGTNPGVVLVSPNGGQIYQASQSVQVTWRTCNLALNARVTIHVVYFDQVNNSAWSLNVLPGPAYFTNNDGVETITLPTSSLITANQGIFGPHYKLMVVVGGVAQDRSDSLITINP